MRSHLTIYESLVISLIQLVNSFEKDHQLLPCPVELDLYKVLQGDFFNWPSPENVSRLAPPKFAWTGPPLNFVSVGIIFTSPDT